MTTFSASKLAWLRSDFGASQAKVPRQTRFGQESPDANRQDGIGRDSLELDSVLDAGIAATRTPEFLWEVAAILARAKSHIQAKLDVLKPGELPGLVLLDVDETTLDNRDFYVDPEKKYYKNPAHPDFWAALRAWAADGKVKANPQVKAFIGWLEEKKVPYAFVTGRFHELYGPTRSNLEKEGVYGSQCQGLYCKDLSQGYVPTGEHKAQMREELPKTLGLELWAVVGDQADDASGDSAKDFILPTSRYYGAVRVKK